MFLYSLLMEACPLRYARRRGRGRVEVRGGDGGKGSEERRRKERGG